MTSDEKKIQLLEEQVKKQNMLIQVLQRKLNILEQENKKRKSEISAINHSISTLK